MIMHIVMWTFKEENKDENIEKFKNMLLELPPIIKEIKHMEVGKNMNFGVGNYDMVLVSEFKSMEDLKTYVEHPAHRKASDFCKAVREKRTCVDYEV